MRELPVRRPRIINAPLEYTFARILSPFEEFIERQSTAGLLLVLATVLALALANTPLAETYRTVLDTTFVVGFADWRLEKTLLHWINDGLMTLFFFVVGLELKREFLIGEFSRPRKAILPIFAAFGGMVVPALIFLLINPTLPGAKGWGIPMATDIAFAVGALVLLGSRIPRSLTAFLIGVAIVDDLGAVLIIAFFYTGNLSTSALLLAGALFFMLIALNAAGIRSPIPYFVLASLMWLAFVKSGVHATIAGVLGAMTVPARPKYDPETFSRLSRRLLKRFDEQYSSNPDVRTNVSLRGLIQTFENALLRVQAPLQRLEHVWHLPVAVIVIPIFALANAGIPLSYTAVSAATVDAVAVGIFFALLIGKTAGISLASWIAIRTGLGELPSNTSFLQIIGVGFLGGIGFTMAIFIAELGFGENPDLLLKAKMGIFAASLLAGAIGISWLFAVSKDAGEKEGEGAHPRKKLLNDQKSSG